MLSGLGRNAPPDAARSDVVLPEPAFTRPESGPVHTIE
jgi:hypothetical protein